MKKIKTPIVVAKPQKIKISKNAHLLAREADERRDKIKTEIENEYTN